MMNKNNLVTQKWQSYESMKTGGSLIISNSGPNFQGNANQKSKLDEILQSKHHNLIARHSSEEEFKKYNARMMTGMGTSDIPIKNNDLYRADKIANLHAEKKTSPEAHLNLRKGNSKGHEKEPPVFKARNSGGRTNALKETASTSSTDYLATHKSEKTFPSFFRNQTKSPQKYLPLGKKGISKENFKIIKRLGEGKFGNVFLAREISTGMIVALKMMPKIRIIQQNFLVQFIRELKIQMFMDHPNIIKNYGFFSDEDNFYSIMELGCDGQLFDIISSGQVLSEESTAFIIGNLLDAVNALHKHKILHRDIKPENIVLVHGNVKLCDFGWAVNKKQELRSTFCGTPLYLSPQLLKGSLYDEKVDLWAVGILAYELRLGCSPFDINEQADLYKIVTDDIEFPQKVKISKQFREFIKAILKKNPKERLPCKQLLGLEFIRKYRELETCEELCN